MSGQNTPIDFCTLGMFIIDDIHPSPTSRDQTIHTNIIGGAGTYSALGARLLSPPPRSRSIGWIIDAGPDFPSDLKEEILSWRTAALIRPRAEPTTHAWNGYGENEHRAFKYLTEKKRLTADDLPTHFLTAKSFHLICSATRCGDLIQRIQERRTSELPSPTENVKQLWIWEPVPDLCIPSELERVYDILPYIDILSPNHDELGSYFHFSHPSTGIDKAAVERQSNEFLARGIGSSSNATGTIVVRCGREGCFIANLNRRRWMPAFFQDATRVVDPTGGGNGFLGGFAVGMVRSGGDVVEAARWGSVAASFCIEQVGVPEFMTELEIGSVMDEMWNGSSVLDRLEGFRKRTM